MSTTPRRPRGHPSRRSRPSRPAHYHDDLPDMFEPLPSDPHLHGAIDHLGIETPGELIDDAPVILPDDGERHRDYRTTLLDQYEDCDAWEPRRER